LPRRLCIYLGLLVCLSPSVSKIAHKLPANFRTVFGSDF